MPRMTSSSLIAEPLWQRTRASFARAIAAIGAPAAIAALTLLSRDLRRAIVGRLLRLEHFVRKLLLAEAAALHRAERARAAKRPRVVTIELGSLGLAQHWTKGSALPAQCTPSRAGADARPRSARASLDRSRPETWPARFSFALPRNPRLVPNARAPRIRAPWDEETPPSPAPERTPRGQTQSTPFRLACRLEALRRVLENPRPHAERLARMLVREVRRYTEVVQRYALAPLRSTDYDTEDERLGIDIYGPCIDAGEVFKNSS